MTGEDKPRELALMVLWQGAEVVVQHRTHKPEGGIGFWGGKVRVGENPQDAAIREAAEEIDKDLIGELVAKNLVRPLTSKIDYQGWRIHSFQAPLDADTKVDSTEGEAIRMMPIDMWKDERLMAASRAVLKETILIPNGLARQE